MRTYHNIKLNTRAPHQITNGVHFQNTPEEVCLITILVDENKEVPKDYVASPWAVHYTALSDIMDAVDGRFVVSKKFKNLLMEFKIPNVEFYLIPLYYGRDNSTTDYRNFKLTEEEYYYMHIKPLNIFDFEIDFSSSEFNYYTWDDFYTLPPRKIFFKSIEDYEVFISDKNNNLDILWSTKLYIKNSNSISDIIFFGRSMLNFHFLNVSAVFSEEIVKAIKKNRIKGVLESVPVIFNGI